MSEIPITAVSPSASSKPVTAAEEEDPDLEDGEIDDDDEEAEPVVIDVDSIIECNSAKDKLQQPSQEQSLKVACPVIDLVGEPVTLPPATKSKKPRAVEDDHASSIEHAIASALKKKGIEPPMPKLMELRSDPDALDATSHGPSRSNRRRKRKRQRDELEKEKERHDKKRMQYELSDATASRPPDDDDVDDYEMLNVRGGSPPPAGSVLVPSVIASQKYDTDDDDSCNSYESYVSQQQHRYESRRGGNKSKESRKSRRERARAREDREERNGRGGEKRSRRDSQSEDSKHRQEPRKLELCKFYLMECCAKKDKCSYMHSDFPCKYYYLGMECVHGDQCKFSHGKPLSEQLRNILLKHLETAPKEILGAFKRICRDTAIEQMATRHEELCKMFNVENKLTSLPTNTSSNARGSNSGDQPHHQQQKQQQKQQQQQQQSQHQTQPVQQPQSQLLIPSLLDIIIKPPAGENPPPSKDKPRKSRWCDKGSSSNNNISKEHNINTSTNEPNSSNMQLKDLIGLVNPDIIEKLSQVGVVNLDQVNQLRFGQLTKIGVTIADISALQMNAQKLANSDQSPKAKEQCSTNRDVDMRFLPSGSHLPRSDASEHDATVCSNSNSNSSNSAVVLVDYSQYLKDSNLSFDRSDIFDDEKDEEQLVIDDGLDAIDDAASSTDETAQDECFSGKSQEHLPQPEIQRVVSPTLKNPFARSLFKHSDDVKEQRDPRSKNAADAASSPSSASQEITNSESLASINSASFIGKFNPFRSHPDDSKSTPVLSETPVYERPSMYDYNPKNAEEDKNSKTDKDMRNRDFSLPFQPAPATELDASINFHLPMQWKLYEAEVPRPRFGSQSFTSNQTIDPRVRRILRLPELPKTNTAAALSRGRSASSSIASPDITGGASPSYYTPPPYSSATTTPTAAPTSTISKIYASQIDDEREKLQTAVTATRLDPRRAAASNANKTTTSSAAQKANIEIRNLLQKSEWYKNLNSTSKIMVNQQLALVSAELKKYHQDVTPDKIFDTQFLVSDPTLQQILTSLGIYINFKGEVCHLERDSDNQAQSNMLPNLNQMPPNMQQQQQQQVPFMQQQHQQQCNNVLPNLNQMPPNMQQVSFLQQQQQQLEFLRGPPPGLPPPINTLQYMSHPGQVHNMSHLPAFAVGLPANEMPSMARPSLLGLPPVVAAPHGNPFNQPFPNVLNCPGPGIMGATPDFGNMRGAPQGMHQQNMQRNFGNSRHNRNQRQKNNN